MTKVTETSPPSEPTNADGDQPTEDDGAQPRSHHRYGPVIAGVVILLGAGVVLFDAIRIGAEGGFGPQQPGLIPMVVGIGLVTFALLFLIRTTVIPDKELADKAAEAHEGIHWRTLWTVIIALIVYAFAFAPLGYIVATSLFIVAVTALVGSNNWLRNTIVGVLFAVAVYMGFTHLLGVRLPAGILETVL